MKLKNLQKVYVYKPVLTEDDGTFIKTWSLVEKKYLMNVQQDVNELDITEAGTINYDVLKLRTDKYYDIEKEYGIALHKLEVNEKPTHIVKAKNIIGRSVTYVCNSYIGE